MPLFGGLFGGLWGGLFGPQGAGAPGSGGTGGGLGMALAGCCCDCTLLFDKFDRDDSTSLGSNWVEENGDWYIEDELLKVDTEAAVLTLSTTLSARVHLSDWYEDQATHTLEAIVTGAKPRLVTLWNSDTNYVFVEFDVAASLAKIRQWNGTTHIERGEYPVTLGAENTVKVCLNQHADEGAHGTIFVNDVLVSGFARQWNSTMRVGLGSGSTDCTFRNVRINKISTRTVTKNYSADATFVVPEGTHFIERAKVWGSGGAGQPGNATDGGHGGGSGGVAEDTVNAVYVGDEIDIEVGETATSGNDGATSRVTLPDTTVIVEATGGEADGTPGDGTIGGALSEPGSSGDAASGETGGDGGDAFDGPVGGGGDGGTTGVNGQAGSGIGAGGGGGGKDAIGGAGGPGKAQLVYYTPDCPQCQECCWPPQLELPETLDVDLEMSLDGMGNPFCPGLIGQYTLTRIDQHFTDKCHGVRSTGGFDPYTTDSPGSPHRCCAVYEFEFDTETHGVKFVRLNIQTAIGTAEEFNPFCIVHVSVCDSDGNRLSAVYTDTRGSGLELTVDDLFISGFCTPLHAIVSVP